MLPEFEASRLRLRAFRLEDAADVQRYVGDYDVARMTSSIPYPYEDGLAEEWIGTHAKERAEQNTLTWAVDLREGEKFVGAASLSVDADTESAELGYWIAKPYWNCGYATEVARTLISYGFDGLGLHRVMARHFTDNPASGRVMQKAGMQYEGTLRHAFRRFGEWRDFAHYSILENEYRSQRD
jgi:[ribosomal protein S5]-alanine N-acetyltransferase